jgi:hypothetical protein
LSKDKPKKLIANKVKIAKIQRLGVMISKLENKILPSWSHRLNILTDAVRNAVQSHLA